MNEGTASAAPVAAGAPSSVLPPPNTGPLDAETIIATATAYLNPEKMGTRKSGQVAAAIVTDRGDLFGGVCIDVPCSMGYCAEAGAIGAMLVAKQSQIAQVVAVIVDESGIVSVLPPCGRCREFMYQVNDKNLAAQVFLGLDSVTTLDELLPARWN
ncbi:cytidine deaminase [Rhodococcus sp. KBW08]|nr:cytidine deaminase [Rhodococcus sp. KBW08]